MPKMIPPYPRAGSNRSEREIFTALEVIQDRPDWVVIHSLDLAQNYAGIMGESDFIVLAPGKGILVIEAKAPNYVEYKNGDWYLDKVPSPQKSPLKQLDNAKRTVRAFLKARGLEGNEPIARLLWFTSISRHKFDNKTPNDMQFFEWELAWQEDIAKPTWIVEKALDEYFNHFTRVDAVKINRVSFDKERVDLIADALLGDFEVGETKEARLQELRRQELTLLDEQLEYLTMVESNDHIYFDGPAGTGKSFLLVEAARRLDERGKKTLLTCVNLMMADELRRMVGNPSIEVHDLNSLMLSLLGMPTNPENADNDWYERELPSQALKALVSNPHLDGYDAICVDEFQDFAANPLFLDVLLALTATGTADGTTLVLAGDESQQILHSGGVRVSALAEARRVVPHLSMFRLSTNCRTAPALMDKIQSVLEIDLDLKGHRISRSVSGDLEVIEVEPGSETTALATALRSVLEEFDPADVRILSPFGTTSLVAGLLSRPEKSLDERWLRKQLVAPGQPGKVDWRSIFKFKGLEADAIIITDVSTEGLEFTRATGVDLQDLLYVGMTRAKYRCVVLDSAGYL